MGSQPDDRIAFRYGGRGVMIYRHVEKRAVCVYPELKRCSLSEVASMIERGFSLLH
ncbi:hypothetical protein AGR7B_pAt0221 [Agrobacterium deltaense RV3]|nr:hypothetical protein AGR7B_pAt0221 [Agrobacterium deltaense RV3]